MSFGHQGTGFLGGDHTMIEHNGKNNLNGFTSHQLPSEQKTSNELVRTKEGEASMTKLDQFRADLRVHLDSELLKSYLDRIG
jgi:hypothetical protein